MRYKCSTVTFIISNAANNKPVYWESLRSYVAKINSNKNIVGYQTNGMRILIPVYWSSVMSVPVDLELGIYTSIISSGINDHQIIVGWSATTNEIALYYSSQLASPIPLHH